MSLLKKRPTLHLELPRRVTLGRALAGTLVMDVAEYLEVERIRIVVRAATVGHKNTTFAAPYEQVVVLSEGRVFELGHQRLPFSLALSTETVPSYHTAHEGRAFHVRAEVVIPWWLDAAVEKTIEVLPPFPERFTAESRTVTSHDAEGGGHEATTIELTVDASAAAAGDILTGQVALLCSPDARFKGIHVGLRECLGDSFDDHFQSVVVREIEGATLDFEELRTGKPVDFSFEVPASFSYSFKSPDRRRFHEVFAVLESTALVSLGWLRVYCPLRVLPTTVPIVRHEVTRRALGSTRQEQAFAEVAERLEAMAQGRQLTRSFGAIRVLISSRIVNDVRNLVADMSYPDLGLGLSIRPGSFLSGGVVASGREAAQIDALMHELTNALPAFACVGSDTSLTVEAPADDSPEALQTFATRAFALAATLERAIAQVPPPAVLVRHQHAFAELARSLAGEVRPSGMIVEGVLDELLVELRPRWSGHDLEGFSARFSFESAADAPDFGDLGAMNPAARELLARLPDVQVSLVDRGLSFFSPRVFTTDAEALAWLHALAAVVRALGPQHSAYR